MLVTLNRPTLRRKDYNAVLNCLVADQIAAGPLNQDLAAGLSKSIRAAGGVALNSYSESLRLALELLELEEGDGVIVSALSPRRCLPVIEAAGLKPMITDVEAQRPLPAIESVAIHQSVGAKALLLHYELGCLPAGEDLFRLGMPVIEEISQAIGGAWLDEPCGARGRAAVLSLGPEGLITAGCGAAVLAGDRKGAKALRERVSDNCGLELLADMNAALGINQLRELPRFLEKRAEIAQLYREALLRSRHAPLLEEGQSLESGFPVFVKDGRPALIRFADKAGIQTQPAFRDALAARPESSGGEAGSYPNADQFLRRGLLFPLYPSLSRREIQLVCRVLSTLP